MPAVSVVIPLHNCEKTVRKSFRSLVNQTYKDFEVIAVDNNCTDDTIEIVKSEFLDLLDIKIVECKDQGIEPALNTGLRSCTADLIARQDGDDYWLPEKLEKQVAFLIDNPEVDILGTQINLYDENGIHQSMGTFGKEVKYPTDSSLIKNAMLHGQNAICHPSVVFRRKSLLLF